MYFNIFKLSTTTSTTFTISTKLYASLNYFYKFYISNFSITYIYSNSGHITYIHNKNKYFVHFMLTSTQKSIKMAQNISLFLCNMYIGQMFDHTKLELYTGTLLI